MSTVKVYLTNLENKYNQSKAIKKWKEFIEVKEGISKENIEKLKELYPDIPNSLIEILKFADGTYHRIYGNNKINLYFLGSDIERYPYYLLSSEQIINNKILANKHYKEYIDRIYDDIYIDDKIIRDSKKMCWLHFSDCMNNGGTSELFIDFAPSEKGKKGQVIRFLHDRDEIKVIADNFDEYLQMLIDNDLDFIE